MTTAKSPKNLVAYLTRLNGEFMLMDMFDKMTTTFKKDLEETILERANNLDIVELLSPQEVRWQVWSIAEWELKQAIVELDSSDPDHGTSPHSFYQAVITIPELRAEVDRFQSYLYGYIYYALACLRPTEYFQRCQIGDLADVINERITSSLLALKPSTEW